MNTIIRTATALALALAATAATAQVSTPVTVKDAWVRATVPGQPATGAFMTLHAQGDARLVSAQSGVAAATEIHEMAMQDDVMKMRQIDGLALPAGQDVPLTPGGYHLMLLELKQPIKAGDQVPISLVFESGGKRQTVEIQAIAKPLSAGMEPSGHGMHGGRQ